MESEFPRVSFSAFSADALDEGISRLPHKYPLELNHEDMATVMTALSELSLNDVNAFSLLSGIFETLNIEVI